MAHHYKTRRSHIAAAILAGLTAACVLPASYAGTEDDGSKTAVTTQTPPSRFHVLFLNDFSDKEMLYSGAIIQNKGVAFQSFVLMTYDIYSPKTPFLGFLNDITITGGAFNFVNSQKAFKYTIPGGGGNSPGYWYEIDPTGGLQFKIFNDFEFDAAYTVFKSETDTYVTNENVQLKLSYHDHYFKSPFTVNPWVGFFDEVNGKSSAQFNTATQELGYTVDLGVDPTYDFGPVKLDLYTHIMLNDKHFWQHVDGNPAGSGVSYFSTDLTATVPLKFVPKDYGSWSVYAGFQYWRIVNPGLRDINEYFGPDPAPNSLRDPDIYQAHFGFSVFF